MARFTSYSSLGRPVDLRFASNRFALAIWLFALALFVGLSWWDGRFTYLAALGASIAVFLAWAIGRELDPDHTSVAAIAALGAVGLVFVGIPSALIVVASLIAVRAVAGTTGTSLKLSDLALLAVAGFASGGDVWSWPIAIVLFVWLKSEPAVGSHRWWGAGALVVGFVIGWYLGDLNPIEFTRAVAYLGLGVFAVTIISLTSVSAISATDSGEGNVSATSLRYARLSGGIIALSAVLLGGEDAFILLGPLMSAIGATTLVVVAGWLGIVDMRPTVVIGEDDSTKDSDGIS